jgi:hypothetical protein
MTRDDLHFLCPFSRNSRVATSSHQWKSPPCSFPSIQCAYSDQTKNSEGTFQRGFFPQGGAQAIHETCCSTKREFLCKSNERPDQVAIYFEHLSNVTIAAVYDGCSCIIPKCLFHKRLFIARWLSDNCLHFPFLIKVDLSIEKKDCCGLKDGQMKMLG